MSSKSERIHLFVPILMNFFFAYVTDDSKKNKICRQIKFREKKIRKIIQK